VKVVARDSWWPPITPPPPTGILIPSPLARPTKGFLGSAAKGPFAGFYHSLAGNGAVDLLFMFALLATGVALTVMMWSAVLPPASNPFMDDHLIYAGVLVVLALMSAVEVDAELCAWRPGATHNPYDGST
jgi:hypothetical protein